MRPKRRSGFASREISDGELVIVTGSGERAIVLNTLGSAVWHLADGQRGIADIAEFIAGHFDALDVGQVEADVRALVDELIAADLLEENT